MIKFIRLLQAATYWNKAIDAASAHRYQDAIYFLDKIEAILPVSPERPISLYDIKRQLLRARMLIRLSQANLAIGVIERSQNLMKSIWKSNYELSYLYAYSAAMAKEILKPESPLEVAKHRYVLDPHLENVDLDMVPKTTRELFPMSDQAARPQK